MLQKLQRLRRRRQPSQAWRRSDSRRPRPLRTLCPRRPIPPPSASSVDSSKWRARRSACTAARRRGRPPPAYPHPRARHARHRPVPPVVPRSSSSHRGEVAAAAEQERQARVLASRRRPLATTEHGTLQGLAATWHPSGRSVAPTGHPFQQQTAAPPFGACLFPQHCRPALKALASCHPAPEHS